MMLIGSISVPYITKAAKSMSACPGDIEPFKDHLSTQKQAIAEAAWV